MTVSSSTINENIAVVRRFIQSVVNEGQFDLIPKLWAEDMAWHGGSLGEIAGVEAYSEMLQQAADGAFEDMRLTIDDIVANDDKVVVRFTNSGKQVGEFLGAPATGRTASWIGIGVYTLRDHMIVDAWFAEDILGMLLQLDAVTIG